MKDTEQLKLEFEFQELNHKMTFTDNLEAETIDRYNEVKLKLIKQKNRKKRT